MNHASLFSGIGGFDLAAEQVGWKNVFNCEVNEFAKKVLKHYWPNAIQYDDIKRTNFAIHRGTIDVLTGGFPCQPYSLAGKRLGKEDDRHLWPEMLRVIREVQPTWVVGENVFGLVNWNGGLVFNEVQTDLEAEGYEVQPYVLPAASVNAPHKRDRVWFVAHRTNSGTKEVQQRRENGIYGFKTTTNSNNESRQERASNRKREGCEQIRERNLLRSYTGRISEIRTITNSESQQSERMRPNESRSCEQEQREFRGGRSENCAESLTPNANGGRQPSQEYRKKKPGWITETGFLGYWEDFPTQPPVCHGDDGISSRLAGITFSNWRNESIKAMGNAIVPQVAIEIFKAIQKYEFI